MAENKKQHYVPQFYLKYFSKNQKQLSIYHIESKKIALSPISSTCQGKFFYGKNTDFEKELAEGEKNQAAVIRKIIEMEKLNNLTQNEYYDLYSFIALQFARTKDSRMLADNYVEFFVENYIKPMMKGREEFKEYSPEYIDSLKITMPKFYMISLILARSGIEGLLDLKPLLLVNKTKKTFISSDAPIVLNNYFKIKSNDLTGFQSPGLQIICPLNDKLTLMLLHDEAYQIDGEFGSIIEVNNDSDVDSLNKLQLLNAFNIVYHVDDQNLEYIHNLHAEILDKKNKKQFVQKTLKTTLQDDGKYSEIVAIYTKGMNYKIRFSFLKMDHTYNRRFKGQCRRILKKTPAIQPYRSKELVERMQYRFDQLIKMQEI